MPIERRIVLAADSAEWRRQLGPTAWVVFEELILASEETGDGCVASVSVRTLADRLDLAKDTIARALGRLRRAGLVIARQSRTDTGVFATGCYVLDVPASITFCDHTPAAPTTPRSSSQRTRQHDHQLALTLST